MDVVLPVVPDVPRQCLGHALCLRHGGGAYGDAGAGPWMGVFGQSDRHLQSHHGFGRADNLAGLLGEAEKADQACSPDPHGCRWVGLSAIDDRRRSANIQCRNHSRLGHDRNVALGTCQPTLAKHGDCR